MIAKQSALVDDLNSQIEKLKEVNSQLDYTWGEKYREMNFVNETGYDKMKRDLQSLLDRERRENGEKVNKMLTEFKTDMQTVETAHKRKQTEASTLTIKLESKVQKQQKAIDELKNLLQMTVKSDQRKDALL